jgi:hypothetical protein
MILLLLLTQTAQYESGMQCSLAKILKQYFMAGCSADVQLSDNTGEVF